MKHATKNVRLWLLLTMLCLTNCEVTVNRSFCIEDGKKNRNVNKKVTVCLADGGMVKGQIQGADTIQE
ncbi:MAG: hypothetical protein ONB16_11720 [candidate division KSB1 bacterium]|nr:hypothetical protein [candidate division KSB1 bacterium]MDZ7340100.1 hypothetical protein [candidate division KSB1 bacterium]